MKILAVCSTYLQIITILKLKKTLFINDDVSIALTYFVPDYKKISERLKETNIFDEITVFVQDKNVEINTRKIFIQSFLKDKYYKNNGVLSDYSFDMLLSGNIFGITEIYFNRINNRNLKVYLILDGAYNYVESEINALVFPDRADKIKHKILNKLEGQYIFHSEFGINITDKFESINVPCLNADDKDILNYVFDYSDEDFGLENKEACYLNQASENTGARINDEKYINVITKYIDAGKVAIKLHPRYKNSGESNTGIDKITSKVPLEIILLNNQNIKLLVTMMSTAALTPELCLNMNVESIFLYRIEPEECKKLLGGSSYDSFDESMIRFKNAFNSVHVVNDIAEFELVMKKFSNR